MIEKMKPSGIVWIGDIPKQWEVKRIKYIISDIKDGTHSTFDRVESGELLLSAKNVFDDGIHIGNNESEISQSDYASIIATGFPRQNDVLLCCVGTIGRCCVYEFEKPLAFQRSVSFLRPLENTAPAFLKYALQSDSTIVQEQLLLNKSAQEGLYMGSVREMVVPMPDTVREQHAIATYLDTKCAKIDSVIEDIKKQIETLQKYRKSLITEVVTKGLNRSVQMKDSGITWIGQMPKHWDVCRIKDVCSLARGGSPRPINEYLSDNPNDLNWIRIGDTTKDSKYITQTEQKIIKSGLSNSRLVHEGDLLLTNSMSFGQPYILKIKGCIHDGWLVFSDYCGIDKLFLYYVLMSELCYIQFKTSVAGAVVENLSIDKVGVSKIFVPPIEEQSKIVEYLDFKCKGIDEILLGKEEQLEIIQSYKKSLIYEYVTGKKRVMEEN